MAVDDWRTCGTEDNNNDILIMIALMKALVAARFAVRELATTANF